MKEVDLSPYLVDIFIHSQQIAEWHNRPQEINRHLEAIETWWQRFNESESTLHMGTAYMMLAHLNMLKGYIYAVDAAEDWRDYYGRIFRLIAEIIEKFGNADFLWKQVQAETKPQPQL